MGAKIPVVLSTDVGNEIDDQWAIVYLLTQPDFEVRGLLSAHAPSLPDPSAHRSYRILQDIVEHRLGLNAHPPLLEGASEPLANGTTPRPSAAAQFLVETSQSFSAERRLNVVVIGAATDLASALLIDPTMADRIRVVAMAFKNLSPDGAHEYNEQNDPEAWRLLLASRVPVVVGTGDVCQRFLSLNYGDAEALLRGHGPVAAWLWGEYQDWYYRNVKPLRVPDFSRSWVIWDVITLAYLQDMAKTTEVPRPTLDATMTFRYNAADKRTFLNISDVDKDRFWASFVAGLDRWLTAHKAAGTQADEPQR